MNYIILFIILLLIIYILYCFLYLRYIKDNKNIKKIEILDNKFLDFKIPYIVNNFLNNFPKWNISFFKKNYGNNIVSIVKSNSVECYFSDLELVKMKLKDFIKKFIENKEKDYESYYYKLEEYYGLKDNYNQIEIIKKYFEKVVENTIASYRAFWFGPKNSITTLHYDIDHVNLLCVLEGKKRILLISPEYNKILYKNYIVKNNWWIENLNIRSENEINNLKQQVKVFDIVVNSGQILNIPCMWWHAVINLDDTIAFTYQYQTLKSCLFIPAYYIFYKFYQYYQ